MDIHIPEKVVRNYRQYGNRSNWIEELPALVASLAGRWSLELGAPYEAETSCAWVAPAMLANGDDAVLKLPMPHSEGRDEAAALRLWDGAGMVKLYDFDEDSGAMLLERCMPGTHLRSRPEEEQDVVIAGLLRLLWVNPPPAHGFRGLEEMIAEWSAEGRAHRSRERDHGLVEEGISVYEQLLAEPHEQVLLATDLHAGNVLSSDRAPWLAIDPKPYVGDPAYDATQHLRNCDERLANAPRETIESFAELLGLEPVRVARWTFARHASETGGNQRIARAVATEWFA